MKGKALAGGARGAQRAYSENRLDRRCGWVREMFDIRSRYLVARNVTDDTCDIERLTLIHRIAFKTITIRMREQAALAAMREKDVPPPDLGKDFFTCAESLRRDEMALIALDDRLRSRSRARRRRPLGRLTTHRRNPPSRLPSSTAGAPLRPSQALFSGVFGRLTPAGGPAYRLVGHARE